LTNSDGPLFDQLIVKASTVDAQVFDDFQKRIDDLRIELRVMTA
jgi:hypothetical protein